jgi:galactokinase
MFSHRTTVNGRVNLIGEHLDYNGGMVLPAALSVSLKIKLVLRNDQNVLVRSDGYKPIARHLSEDALDHWSDPVVGAVKEGKKLGLNDCGANIEITSSIPVGSGLSSSAALITAVLKALRGACGGTHSDMDIAIAAKRVENNYMGVPCGIMDQIAVGLLETGKAIALDTRTLNHDLLELPSSHAFVVSHSGISRRLADSNYGARKHECDQLKSLLRTEDLCLIDPKEVLKAPIREHLKKRALHCIDEHRRVLRAVQALREGDMDCFGNEMNESHDSMRDQFEISIPEIDSLVSDAQNAGAIGARLTGAGFGGCIVACIPQDTEDSFLKKVLGVHPLATHIDTIAGQRS